MQLISILFFFCQEHRLSFVSVRFKSVWSEFWGEGAKECEGLYKVKLEGCQKGTR